MRQPAKSFEDLLVWQKSHQFVLAVYRLTREFPKTELYGLTLQLRRAAHQFPLTLQKGLRGEGMQTRSVL